MVECPDCDFEDDAYHAVFEHRVKNHTSAGDAETFNLYDEEVFEIFNEMAVTRALERIDETNPSVERLKYELREMGVPVGLDDSIQPIEEYAEE